MNKNQKQIKALFPDSDMFAGPREGEPLWLDVRGDVIGASSSAQACGVSPYGSVLELFEQMESGKAKEFDEAAIARMRRGRRAQAFFADEYLDEVGTKLIENDTLWRSHSRPWLGATLDFVATPKDDDGKPLPPYIVEAKATQYGMVDKSGEDVNKYGESETDQVPVSVLYQAQHQMLVTGAEICEVLVFVGWFDMRRYPIHADADLQADILEHGEDLIERLETGNPPPADYANPATVKLLQDRYGYLPDVVAEIDNPTAALLCSEFSRAAEARKAAKKYEDRCRAQLLDILQGAAAADVSIDGTAIATVKRSKVAASVVTEADVEKLAAKIGEQKRAASERFAVKLLVPEAEAKTLTQNEAEKCLPN